MKRFLPFAVLFLSPAYHAAAFTPESDGIYAVFDITYWDGETQTNTGGEFTIQLMLGEAPVTCANFIGLAEGTLPWFDFETRTVRGGFDNPEPFYNGLTFHRVVPNFVIQTGSRNGLGTDGPGWRIPDEAYPGRDHVGGGVVSMANNGPNTGGSQFFITMAQFPETQRQLDALNGKHTIFAVVVDGIMVTQAVNLTPVAGSSPINPAVINSVTIVRQGEAANSWDPSQFWISPDFSSVPFSITNNIEDTDDDGEPDTRFLKGVFTRDPHSIYHFQQSNNLEDWSTLTFDRQLFAPGEEPREETRFLLGDVVNDGRHFYNVIEGELPPVEYLDGRRLILDIDPVEDVGQNVTYQPERFVADFYDELDGGWKLKRSDSEMEPIGSIGTYRQFPVGWRTQLHLQNNGFSEMQVYLDYADNNRDSGDAHIYYVNGRNEGSLVSGAFTLAEGQPRRELQDKNLTRLMVEVINDQGQEPVTITYTLDLWDNFSEEEFNAFFEGGYRIERSTTEFVQQGRLIYQWMVVDGLTYVNIDFDSGQDFQTVLNNPESGSGSARVFYPSLDAFFDGTYTLGEGNPRADPIDQAGNKFILTLDLTGENTDPVQSQIDIDFYEAAEGLVPGGYEATRTDSEVNQFGDLVSYEWIEQDGEIRVSLSYDIIQPMQVYLTFTSGDSTNGGSGTASIHYPQFGSVGEGAFEFIVDGGNDRPEPADKTGTRLELNLAEEVINVLTIDLYGADTGLYRTTRTDSTAQPSGEVLEYQWFERANGEQLVLIDYDRLPDSQILLTPDAGGSTGQAEILYLDSGTLLTSSYTIGEAPPEPVSLDKTATKLVLDLENTGDNTTIDLVEVVFNDFETGSWTRTYPPDITLDPDSGDVVEYQWYEREGFDQVNIVYDFLRNMQVFMTYDTATSGTAVVYFVTGAAIVDATFTIENP